MSRKMIRLWLWVAAAVVVTVSFLYGCSSSTAGKTTEAEIADNTESGQQAYEAVRYGEVQSIDGSNVTVVLGAMGNSSENISKDTGEGENRVIDVKDFVAGTDQLSFNAAVVDLSDQNGVAIESNSLTPGDILSLSGTGEGNDFVPTKVQIVNAPAS